MVCIEDRICSRCIPTGSSSRQTCRTSKDCIHLTGEALPISRKSRSRHLSLVADRVRSPERYLLPLRVVTLTAVLTCVEIVGCLALESEAEEVGRIRDRLYLNSRCIIERSLFADSHLCIVVKTIDEAEAEACAVSRDLRYGEILNTETTQVKFLNADRIYCCIVPCGAVDITITECKASGTKQLRRDRKGIRLELTPCCSLRTSCERYEGRSSSYIGHVTELQITTVRCILMLVPEADLQSLCTYLKLRQDSIAILSTGG